ncbi:hypothetical protein V1389_10520 [Flavobacterium rakeshii]|uniref:hypothetical protein n=1 Tax=Flavobacterium rakeshii TaxID=1038845 RepID=UPI002E7C4404|nr:hypothetical protein [Flavobacterium rakeshii]MEE1898772.1 hypothetical protein [Flavobacterium rakeshii]
MKYLFVLLLTLSLTGCDKNDVSYKQTDMLEGKGVFTYQGYEPLSSKPVNVYYYVPENSDSTTPVLFALHGANRNAIDYRDAWITYAETNKAIIVAPEFSDAYYPGGDAYNLGNMFTDGDNPSATTLNPESEWTFSIIEPLFSYIKSVTPTSVSTYNMYGHSAGAQFLQKFILLDSATHLNKALASGAGWYTDIDTSIEFPYGLAESPLADINPSNYFAKKVLIQVGENDTDPNSPGLRHNSTVDLQGLTRYDRAIHFFNLSENAAATSSSTFNWELQTVPNATHEFTESIEQAAAWLMSE